MLPSNAKERYQIDTSENGLKKLVGERQQKKRKKTIFFFFLRPKFKQIIVLNWMN